MTLDVATLIALIGLILAVLGQAIWLGWWASGQNGRTKSCEDAIARLGGEVREMRGKLDERATAENALSNALVKLTATVEALQRSVDRLIDTEAAQLTPSAQRSGAVEEFRQLFEIVSAFDRMRAAS